MDLKKLKEFFEKYPNINSVILFGSHAKPLTSKFSDLDLLIDGEFDEGKLSNELKQLLGRSVEVDLLEIQKTPIKILKDALNEGVILKGDEKRLADLRYRVALEYPEIWMECELNSDRLLSLDCELKRERIMDQFANFVRNCDWVRDFLAEHRAEEISANEGLQYELKWPLFEAIQSLIDLCAGVVSDLKLGVAGSFGEYVDKLVEAKRMPNRLGSKLRDFISFRNRMVHLYLGVKINETITKARELVRCMPTVRDWVERLVKEKS